MVTGKVMVPTGKTLVPLNPMSGMSNGQKPLLFNTHLLKCRLIEDVN